MTYPALPNVGVPFGALMSFGSIQFAPQSPLQEYTLEWVTATTTMMDNAFPIDLYGNGPTPLVTPTASWQTVLVADCAPGNTTSPYAQVEDAYNAIYSILRTSGGQVATLTVQDARGHARTCRARIKKFECKPVPGHNSTHYVPVITFLLLTDFT